MEIVNSNSDEIFDKSGLLSDLLNAIVEYNPVHRGFLVRAVSHLTPVERGRLENILGYYSDTGKSIDYVAGCYLTVVADTLAEQMFFLRHNHYRHSSYEDVANSVYHNREYMDKYMYGLMITAFLWPNHIEIARFFNANLPTGRRGQYLEVGPGHGYFMATAASTGSFDALTGVDISEASLAQTRALMAHVAPQAVAKCDFIAGDFLGTTNFAADSYDAIVMGEVLEHVEQPAAFLRRIHELAKDDAFVYITTCVNAPAVDHIYLWRSVEELEEMIADCGFLPTKALRLPYEGRTMEQARDQRLSINVAYLLAKRPA